MFAIYNIETQETPVFVMNTPKSLKKNQVALKVVYESLDRPSKYDIPIPEWEVYLDVMEYVRTTHKRVDFTDQDLVIKITGVKYDWHANDYEVSTDSAYFPRVDITLGEGQLPTEELVIEKVKEYFSDYTWGEVIVS